jgi:hypothetical protein
LLLVQRIQLRDRRSQFLVGGGKRLLGIALHLESNVALDLEASQIDQQRFLARRQRVGLRTKGAETIGGALLRFLSAGA